MHTLRVLFMPWSHVDCTSTSLGMVGMSLQIRTVARSCFTTFIAHFSLSSKDASLSSRIEHAVFFSSDECLDKSLLVHKEISWPNNTFV